MRLLEAFYSNCETEYFSWETSFTLHFSRMALVVAEQPANQPNVNINRALVENSEDTGIRPEAVGPKQKSVNALNKKHKTLSLSQKHDLILCRDENSKLTYAELQEIAFVRWKVRPSMGALSRLFRKEIIEKVRRFIRLNSGDSSCMRQRPSRVHGLNEALAAWERAAGCTPGNWVTDDQLVAKAKEIGARMDLPADFKYSKTNWLAEFKKKVRLCASSRAQHRVSSFNLSHNVRV